MLSIGAAWVLLQLCFSRCALKRTGTHILKTNVVGRGVTTLVPGCGAGCLKPNLKNPKPYASTLTANSCCRYDFDIPILAMDLVAAGGAVTLAIIDACPVSPRLTLPQHYSQTMLELQHEFLPGGERGQRCVGNTPGA